jgi:DNA polymerase
MREVLMVGVPVDDEDDDADTEAEQEFSVARERIARVLAMLDAKHANGGLSLAETKAREVAAIRLYGAGAAPKKFARLEAQQVDGVLRGQYRFAGAGQTGRLTSRGAQIQNLTRDVLGDDGAAESPLVEAIRKGCDYAALVAASPADAPAARKLALIVRPALVAGPGKLFVWSDWSAIEARITPWLAASEDAERVLDIFRANDRDPTRPDSYTVAAADIFHNSPSEITKSERQIGKVATLALGFGGSVGALLSMALAYRIHLDAVEARHIVDAWREANPWAREFWGAHRDGESFGLWGAAMRAWELPGSITTAGRLAFVYRDDYLGGALFMALPSGRLLTYPRPRWRDVDVLDKNGNPTGEKRTELSFRRAHGRAKLWHGTLCENAVQATAADILRETATRIETNPVLAFMPIRMTTHDEIVCEVDAARADEAKAILRREMLTLPKWAEGLPLQSEESVCARYTKSKITLSRGGKS